jgi:hypothetical protein
LGTWHATNGRKINLNFWYKKPEGNRPIARWRVHMEIGLKEMR